MGQVRSFIQRVSEPLEEICSDIISCIPTDLPGHWKQELLQEQLLPLGEELGCANSSLVLLAGAAKLQGSGASVMLMASWMQETIYPACCILSSTSFSALAWKMYTRWPAETERTLQLRSSLVCVIMAVTQLFVPVLSPWTANPATNACITYFLQEAVTLPLIVLNLGFVAGRTAGDMRSATICTAGGFCGLAGTALLHKSAMVPLMTVFSASMLLKAFDTVYYKLPIHASNVSALNKIRIEMASSVFVPLFFLGPMVAGLGSMHIIPLAMMQGSFLTIHLLSKTCTNHLLMNAWDTVQQAAAHMNAKRRAV